MKIKNEVAGSDDADAVGLNIQLVSDSPESIYDLLGVAGTLPSQTAPDPTDTNPTDPTTPEVDTDGDGTMDSSDPDIDGDGILNADDADHPDNASELDTDGDGIIDSSDPDIDGDGILNADDADHPDNASELDTDGDGIIDSSDPDIDGDGILNADDADPTEPNMSVSTTPSEYAAAEAFLTENQDSPVIVSMEIVNTTNQSGDTVNGIEFKVLDTRTFTSPAPVFSFLVSQNNHPVGTNWTGHDVLDADGYTSNGVTLNQFTKSGSLYTGTLILDQHAHVGTQYYKTLVLNSKGPMAAMVGDISSIDPPVPINFDTVGNTWEADLSKYEMIRLHDHPTYSDFVWDGTFYDLESDLGPSDGDGTDPGDPKKVYKSKESANVSILWYSNPSGYDYWGFGHTNPTWIMWEGSQGSPVGDFSGGSADITNGSEMFPADSFTVYPTQTDSSDPGESELSAPVAANSYTILDYDSSYGINVSMAGNASAIAWSKPAANGAAGYGAGEIYYANNSGSSWGSKQTIPNSSYVASEYTGYTTQLSYDGLVLASAGKCKQDSTNRVHIRINRRSTNSESFALSETITKDFLYNTASTLTSVPRFKLSGDGNTIVLYMYGKIGSGDGYSPDAGIWIYKWNGTSWVEKNFDSSYTLQNRRDEREVKSPVKWGDSRSSALFDIDPMLMTDVSHNGDMIYSLVVDPAVTTGPRRFHLKGYKYDSGLDEYDSTWMSYTTDHATSISCGKSGSSIAWSLHGEAKARYGEVGNDGTLISLTIVDFVPTTGDVNSWDENASGTEIHSCVTMEETDNPYGDDLGVSVALSWRVNSLGGSSQFYSATNVFEYNDSSIWVEKGTFEGGYDRALPFVQLSNDAKSLIYYRNAGPYYGHVGKVLKRTALPYGWA